MATNSTGGTLGVAAVLCIVCSILVSTAAVKLKPLQTENKNFDIKKNLLLSAGLIKNPSASKDEVSEAFKAISTYVIDLESGNLLKDVKPDSVDLKKEAKDPKLNIRIPKNKDLGKIKYRAKRSKIYFVKKDGNISMLILPVYGKGLWSTMFGFLALSPDTRTVEGFGFYDHGETPGLGGEVDNPRWKSLWKGKQLFGENFKPIINVIKGAVNPNSESAKNSVDGLSGATITSRGVQSLLRYWLDDHGYGPFLKKFRAGGIQI
jgi:Na+-transporting NADH:ubiquinone oxidoreductase subunit C